MCITSGLLVRFMLKYQNVPGCMIHAFAKNVLVFRFTEFRCSGVPVFWCSGVPCSCRLVFHVPVFRVPCSDGREFLYSGVPCSLFRCFSLSILVHATRDMSMNQFLINFNMTLKITLTVSNIFNPSKMTQDQNSQKMLVDCTN